MMFAALHHRRRKGFIFLVSVLVIGSIAADIAISLVLLGVAALQRGISVVQSAQAYEYAQTCAERAIRRLQTDLSYDGGEVITFSSGTCSIAHTGGSGNTDRVLCVRGVSGQATRSVEISIAHVYPNVKVVSWGEVESFFRCP